jgi:hypothetical protein
MGVQGHRYTAKLSSFEWAPNESSDGKAREKCVQQLSRILSTEDDELQLTIKVTKKNLSEVKTIARGKKKTITRGKNNRPRYKNNRPRYKNIRPM